MIPFIDLQAQRRRIDGEVRAAIARVLEHGQYIMGPEVGELERQLAEFSGARHVITCANGTDALVLALMALGIGESDAVFVPSFTFVATVEAVRLVRATPVFVDVSKDTFNLCPNSLDVAIRYAQELELMPKAVIPVDLFGQPADYDGIRSIVDRYGLSVIADAAQSFGAALDNRRVGTLGYITTTSFFPAKPLGCYGDGGAILTDDDDMATLMRSFRNHGQGKDRYDNVRIGLNSRLDTLQAAILLEKLKIFPDEIAARERVARRYIAGMPKALASQCVMRGATSVWAQFTIVAEDRERYRKGLEAAKIPTAVYYPKPNHVQPPYVNAPKDPNGLPNTEQLQQCAFSLPMHPYLDSEIQDNILAVLSELADQK